MNLKEKLLEMCEGVWYSLYVKRNIAGKNGTATLFREEQR